LAATYGELIRQECYCINSDTGVYVQQNEYMSTVNQGYTGDNYHIANYVQLNNFVHETLVEFHRAQTIELSHNIQR